MSGPGRCGMFPPSSEFPREALGREPRLIGLDVSIEVGEARLSLYLDDHGELLLDEWTGTAEARAVVSALAMAQAVVESFKEDQS